MPLGRRTAIAWLSTFVFTACDKDDSAEKNTDPSFTIDFRASIGVDAIACGRSYPNQGSTASSIEVRDFRFFIYNPQFIAEDGSKVPLNLSKDGKWQRDQVALLDFTDGTGLCDPSGTSTNTSLRGTAPAGNYKGFSFQFGLPPQLNHLNAATETAPFNETGMWWTWKGGYKFARFDFKSTGQDTFFFHMGATSCQGSIETSFSCAYDHEATMSFAQFSPEAQAIQLDVQTLFADSDFDSPNNPAAGDVVKGCMAFSQDPECTPIFQKLGLVFESKEAGPEQTVFTVVNKN